MKNFDSLVSVNVAFLTALALVFVLVPESFLSCCPGEGASRVVELTRHLGLSLGAAALALYLLGSVAGRSSRTILLVGLVIVGGIAQLVAFYLQNHRLQSEAGFFLLVSVTLINAFNLLGLIRSLVLPARREVEGGDEPSDSPWVVGGRSMRSILPIAGVVIAAGWIAPEALRDLLAPEGAPATVLLGVSGALALGGLLSWGVGSFEAKGRRALERGTRDRWLRQIGEAAAGEERNRLARELHDSIKQQIFSIKMSSAAVAERWDSDRFGARKSLDDVRRCAHEAMVEMQALLLQLRPDALVNVGLVEALKEQCEALRYRTGAAVRCEVEDLPPESDLPPNVQQTLFRIAQEMFSNVSRHARATRVDLRLRQEGRELVLSVEDDGQGFEPGESEAGFGLKGIRERVEEFRGSFDLASSPGAGTRVEVRIPLDGSPVAAPEDPGTAAGTPAPTLLATFSPLAIVALGACLAPWVLPRAYMDPEASAGLSRWLHWGLPAVAAIVFGTTWSARSRGTISEPRAQVAWLRTFLLLATAFWWSPQFWLTTPRDGWTEVSVPVFSVSVGLLAALPLWRFGRSQGTEALGGMVVPGLFLAAWLLSVGFGSWLSFADPGRSVLAITAGLGGAATVGLYLAGILVLWAQLRTLEEETP